MLISVKPLMRRLYSLFWTYDQAPPSFLISTTLWPQAACMTRTWSSLSLLAPSSSVMPGHIRCGSGYSLLTHSKPCSLLPEPTGSGM